MRSIAAAILFIFILVPASDGGPALAGQDRPSGILFQDREIRLQPSTDGRVILSVAGSTAARGHIPLAPGGRPQQIDLGHLGFWEKVPDPPSFLRNYDLELTVHNRFDGPFRIELAYDPSGRQIRFRVLDGEIRVRRDRGSVPQLTILPAVDTSPAAPTIAAKPSGPRLVFFDFNSFDGDLRQYYGRIKRILDDRSITPFFYCYETDGYDPAFFRIYRDPGRLDTAKMGLSLEDGNLAYYRQTLQRLKAHQGDALEGRITLVTRFGGSHATALNRFAREIGIRAEGDIRFQSYAELE